jgi:hypothetical protein
MRRRSVWLHRLRRLVGGEDDTAGGDYIGTVWQ